MVRVKVQGRDEVVMVERDGSPAELAPSAEKMSYNQTTAVFLPPGVNPDCLVCFSSLEGQD